jgi:hypothetical protein
MLVMRSGDGVFDQAAVDLLLLGLTEKLAVGRVAC